MLMPRRKWKDIQGYEGIYQISNLGEIRSFDRVVKYKNRYGNELQYLKRGRKLQPIKTKNGYLLVTLSKNNKKERYLVHRLVAQAFVPNPYNLNEVNHIDEKPNNPLWTNLEWVTHKQNMNHGTVKQRISNSSKGKKFKKETVKKISEKHCKRIYCSELDMYFESINEGAKYIGVHNSSLSKHLKGIYKTCGGYHWNFVY